MKDHDYNNSCTEDHGPCACLPNPVRMNYFYGQLISERDLLTEQAYFRDKLRHANRCLHGYGVICGMIATPLDPPQECEPKDSPQRRKLRALIAKLDAALKELKLVEDAAESDDEKKDIREKARQIEAEQEAALQELEELTHARPDQSDDCAESTPLHRVKVSCGVAIDCNGNDVILTRDRVVDLWGLLKPAERDQLADSAETTVYLSVCYEECGSEPTRPVALDSCATTAGCEMARIMEGARLTASLTKPAEDTRCDPCCTCCDDPCILLATITLAKDEPVTQDDIDNGARRRFGLYDPTVITGINWVNGTAYSRDVANDLLGWKDDDAGLVITFSRPVHVSTIIPGTVEIMRITGGGGLSGVLAAMEGEFVDLPDDGMVDRIRYRNTTGESVQEKDRIMVIVRAPFLLDQCCHPVAGLHVGGRVPRLHLDGEADQAAMKEEQAAGVPAHEACLHPPQGPMAWTSNGQGNFESWFWISGDQ